MKPLYAGLLMFCATIATGIAILRIYAPATPVIVRPAPRAAAPAALPNLSTPFKSTVKHFAKRSQAPIARAIPEKRQPLRTGFGQTDGQTGAIFSGADPKDPRIYHFSDPQ